MCLLCSSTYLIDLFSSLFAQITTMIDEERKAGGVTDNLLLECIARGLPRRSYRSEGMKYII